MGWTDPADDIIMQDAARQSMAQLRKLVDVHLEATGLYPNYAIFDTDEKLLYGKANLKRLKEIAKKVDPEGVMGLAGGFKV
jgi:hypothetical protein